MTKKLKVILLIVLTAVCAATAFTGCKIGRPGREEVLAGYGAHVTYYANGGYFDGNRNMTVRELYFKDTGKEEGVPFFDIYDVYEDNSNKGNVTVTYDGYDFTGWYVPAKHTDEKHLGTYKYFYIPEGEKEPVYVYPVLDENDEPVTDVVEDRPVFAAEGDEDDKDKWVNESKVSLEPSETLVDKTWRIGNTENLIVCASWVPSLKVKFQLVCEEGKEYEIANPKKGEEGKTYKNGDIIRSDNFGRLNTKAPTTGRPLDLKGASFVHTYTVPVNDYKDSTKEKMVGTINRPEPKEDGTVDDIIVYSWYLDGAGWNIVETADHAIGMMNGLASSGKYYVMNDVDMNDATVFLKNASASQPEICQATIEGHGFTISNMKVDDNISGGNFTLSLFGILGENADIKDLKLDGIKINVTGRYGSKVTFYAITSFMHKDAKVSGLEVSNITATITVPPHDENSPFVKAEIYNMDDINNMTCWLFGGETTDEAFLAKHTGFKVSGTNTASAIVLSATTEE